MDDDIPQALPLKKSDTHSFALPNISNTQSKMPSYRTARANTTRHHSVFLDKIKDLTKDVKYEQMQTTKINDQQKQLKGLLRQFNHETYNILGRYIDKPIDTRSTKPRATSTSMMEVKDKQIANSNDAMEICKKQMEVLQRKCENLKYVTVEDFQRQIDSIKVEIEQLRTSNKEIIKGNTLRGLSIKRGDAKVTHQVSQYQQQKLILQKKKQKLKEDMTFVTQQQEKLKQNHNKADENITKLTEQYIKYEKNMKEAKDQKQLTKIYDEKRRQYESRKQKGQKKIQSQSGLLQQQKNCIMKLIKSEQNEKPQQNQKKQQKQNDLSVNLNQDSLKKNKKESMMKQPNTSRYQYHYLKLLKQLDEITKKSKQHDSQIQLLNLKVLNARKEILQNEQKLQSAKRNNLDKSDRRNTQANDKNKKEEQQKLAQQAKQQDSGKKWSFF